MKKLMAIILALAMVLALAACGNDDNSGGGKDTPPVIPNLPAIEENPVSDFEYRAIAGGIEITQYIGTRVRVGIPEAIEGVPVISIGDRAFFQTGIMEVHVPSGVTNIGRSAFSGNEALTNITMANNTINAGSLIHFGGVFWRVLEVQDGRALIITEDVTERKPYHADGGEITWEHSTVRQYLNGEFYNSFSSSEQGRIVETTIINSNNPTHGTAGGNNTTDNIFLLSIDEAQTYFTDNASRIAINANGEAIWWWLRSPSTDGDCAAFVSEDGIVRVSGYDVSDNDGGVRPALWLNL
ncbi:MAG: leucine-rich repeat domain-containing protein [Oscillospiraceae bacterium]|nr:leucine-rich repeat domain-containing protein [Oscillospiraceae bacterium]